MLNKRLNESEINYYTIRKERDLLKYNLEEAIGKLT